MNQILQILDTNLKSNYISRNNTYLRKMKLVFWLSIVVIVICIIAYFFIQYNYFKKEQISKKLMNNYDIQCLYSNNTNNDNYYTAQKTILLQYNNNNNIEPFVVGLLKIDKINITYPILSIVNEESLEISPCRFYGPMPNEIGNLCIAGHNYANQSHFGRLSSLENGDIIKIYDLNGNGIEYIVYDKKEVEANDFSCTDQNTNNSKEITLITCNTMKNTRIVIKARENK